jgi:DNA polymerase-3 subunit alpha
MLLELAMSLEGLTRNAGKHAGGVVIAPTVLTDFTPLFCEAGRRRGHAVRQGRRRGRGPGEVRLPRPAHADDHRVRAQDDQRAAGPPASAPLDMARLPMDDAPTYQLLRTGDTTAVFQLESSGMKRPADAAEARHASRT